MQFAGERFNFWQIRFRTFVLCFNAEDESRSGLPPRKLKPVDGEANAATGLFAFGNETQIRKLPSPPGLSGIGRGRLAGSTVSMLP